MMLMMMLVVVLLLVVEVIKSEGGRWKDRERKKWV